MEDTVYLIGAGMHQIVKEHALSKDGRPYDPPQFVSPPMTSNFFQVALKMGRFSSDHYIERVKELYDFIEKYWKKDKLALASEPFNLEECFSFIESQINEAQKPKVDQVRIKELMGIRSMLRILVAEVLSEFQCSVLLSDTMRQFGSLLYFQKPVIITFNYDTILENIIEFGSGTTMARPPRPVLNADSNRVSDAEITYCSHNWNSLLGYGITEFDEVQLQPPGDRMYVDGKKFFENLTPYNWYILKMHGSLNWFQYIPISVYSDAVAKKLGISQEPRLGTILGKHYFWRNDLQKRMDGILTR